MRGGPAGVDADVPQLRTVPCLGAAFVALSEVLGLRCSLSPGAVQESLAEIPLGDVNRE